MNATNKPSTQGLAFPPSSQPLPADQRCTAALLRALQRWPLLQQGRIGIALSGGADSTALLYAAHALWPTRIVALHVNHQLQTAATQFAASCQRHCQHLAIDYHSLDLDLQHSPGTSLEARARQARYAALAEMAQQHKLVALLLAQHADDQAETLLLALSRGAGLAGLAAMPAQFTRHNCVFIRPFLDLSGPSLRQYLNSAQIAWCEDPMNADWRYTRSRIRHTLLPVFEQHFPGWRQSLARSARHAASANSILQELASVDFASVGQPPRIKTLQTLSTARMALVLRHWLQQAHQQQASTAQLDALQALIRACTTRGHRIHLKVGTGFVTRQGECLQWQQTSCVKHQVEK